MEYLLFLQQVRQALGGVLDSFMLEISTLAESTFTFMYFALIYWCLDKETGILVGFNISLASWANQWLKQVFKIERPWVRNQEITPVEGALATATGYSMPSGHTTRAMAVYGASGYGFWSQAGKGIKKKENRIAGVILWLMVALVMFSRNYLGVHTPWDVLAAFGLGILFMIISSLILKWTARGGNRDIIAALVIGLVALLPMLRFGCLSNAGFTYGFLISWILERRLVGFKVEGSPVERGARYLAGAVILLFMLVSGNSLLAYVLPDKYTGFFLQALVAFYVVFLYPLVFTWLKEEAKAKKRIASGCMALVLVVCLGLTGYAGVYNRFLAGASAETNQETVSLAPTRTAKVIAHRGFSGIAPENTLESFERAVDLGVDMVETDVQETKDGVLVIFHDEDMTRITGNSGYVSDYTYDELCQMDFGSYITTASGTGMSAQSLSDNYAGAQILTLDQFLEYISTTNVEVYLELKDISQQPNLTEESKASFASDVVARVESYGLTDRTLFASFNYDYLVQMKAVNASIRTLCNTLLGDADALLRDYDADYYGLYIESMDTDTIAKLHAAGKYAYVFTPNTASQMQYAISLGADGVCTNYPDLAKVVLEDSYSYLTDNYQSSFTIPLLYDKILGAQYENYIVQGLTKISSYIVISAYDYDKEKNSVLYIMDLSGNLLSIVDIGFIAHVGGLAYDTAHDYLWVCGPDGLVDAFSWTDILNGTNPGGVGDIQVTIDPELYNQAGGKVASFITCDQDKLYVGCYMEEGQDTSSDSGDCGQLRAYDLAPINEGAEPTLTDTYDIPLYIQGITFDTDVVTGTRRMLLSQSYNMAHALEGDGTTRDSALLYFTMTDGQTDYTQPEESYTLPEGAEQIQMTAEGLYIMFESSARPYRDVARVVNDQVWVVKGK